MEVPLRRLHQLNRFLNNKHVKPWYRRQSEQSSNPKQIYRKYFQTSSRKIHTIGGVMWNNNEYQQQQSRSFSSKKSNMIDTKKVIRRWHTAKDAISDYGQKINAISYNILAQDLLVGHLELYAHCNPLYLRWSYRMPRLIEEIVSYKPDILCLQEVQEGHLDDIALSLKSHLPLDFVYKKKTGVSNDGCAIFFNKLLFELVESDAVEYYQPGFERFDRHNIAVIAKLRCKSNPDYILLVCTTHLLYNPRRQDVRLAQLMLLLAELDRHVVRFDEKTGRMRKLPLILMGDFNFPPNSAPFELLATGMLSYDKLTKYTLTDGEGPHAGKMLVSPSLGITDNCQHIDCVQSNYQCIKPRIHTMKDVPGNPDYRSVNPTNLTNFSTGTLTHSFDLKSIFNHIKNLQDFGSTRHYEWITVDHFFYGEGLGLNSSIELMATYELPSVAQCECIPPLPCATISSDHLLLAAKFNLVFDDETTTEIIDDL